MCPDDPSSTDSASDDPSADGRQRIVRVPGSRRVKLTPAPGTISEPITVDEEETDAAASGSPSSTTSGPNDDRLRQDVPPHY